jgi:hypothetical protein
MAPQTNTLLRSVSSLLLLVVGCGPGPLPAENPPATLSAPLEPIPVQVESTVHSEVKTTPSSAPSSATTNELEAPPSSELKTPESVVCDSNSEPKLGSLVHEQPACRDRARSVAFSRQF